jgi:hypothetical protein
MGSLDLEDLATLLLQLCKRDEVVRLGQWAQSYSWGNEFLASGAVLRVDSYC